MMNRVRVGLKFCGGCDPTFDRGEYYRAIDNAAAGRIDWRPLDEGGFEAALVINGCPQACPVVEGRIDLNYRVVSVIDDSIDPAEIVAELLNEK